MNDIEKEKVRQAVLADNQRMQDAMAPLYLGKTCPILDRECEGPRCTFFLLQTGDTGKIEGGACSIPLLASQAGPIAGGMFKLASMVEQSTSLAPKILAPPTGLIKG